MTVSPDSSAASDRSVSVSGTGGTTILVERFCGLRGLRVLVAEDHPVNRLIVKEILEAVGIQVFLAANGREAVERVNALGGMLDAVLMDIQMPVMDGLQACREIRSVFSPEALPVVAMTAQIRLSENNGLAEAGMNGMLEKPVSVERLYRLIAGLCKREPGPVEDSQPASGPDSDQSLPAQQIPGIRFEAACVRVNGNVRLLVRLIRMFVQKHQNVTSRLGSLIAAGELVRAARLLHGIQGAAGNIAAERLYQASRELESALRGGEQSDVSGLFSAFVEAFEELRRAAEALPELPDKEPVPADASDAPVDWPLLLSELKHLLERNALAAGDLVEKLALLAGDMEPLLTDLTDLVHKLEYRQALALLQTVAERSRLQAGELTR